MITRPDGRTYRPRKPGLRAHPWGEDDEVGVVIFGTLNPAEAYGMAVSSASYWFGDGEATAPEADWYRDGFYRGERAWVRDEVRGAPGVMFTWDMP